MDSILIDEARTPLIISGMGEKSTQLYDMAEMFVRPLKKLVIAETDEKAEEDVNIDGSPGGRTPPSTTTSTRPSRPTA